MFHQEALDIVQIPKEDQEHAFSMLAAVLWLGNISFQVVDSENHVEVVANEGKISEFSFVCYFCDGRFALCVFQMPHFWLSTLTFVVIIFDIFFFLNYFVRNQPKAFIPHGKFRNMVMVLSRNTECLAHPWKNKLK